MGSHTNFKNFGDAAPASGNHPLARQSSVYSLTFDEFQNTVGGSGKDFGSMNMDELLKSIWSAEETQILASNAGAGTGGSIAPCGNLQRQGSITLPRTLSQKTVDEVWRDLVKENDEIKVSNNGVSGGSNWPQRQQTLGEMTLEEFLVRAGIVREDAQAQAIGRPNNIANNSANQLAFGFQQPDRSNGIFDNRVTQMNNSVLNQPSSLPMGFSVVRSSQQQLQQKPQQHQQPPPLLAKPVATVAFAPPMHLVSNAQLTSAGARETNQMMAGGTAPAVSAALVQGSGVSMANTIGARGVTFAAVSPKSHLSPDIIPKGSIDSPSSLSPVPYIFNRRGKCSAALEKVIERRQRRMIKNRESAARSRARKQAYTLELEAEVAKLKEMNEELQRKQAEFMEMQKNKILETMNEQWGCKRQCLRRTLTGPW